MNIKNLMTIIALSMILTSCNAVKESSKTEANAYFKVEVEQDGKIIKEKNNIILLEKKPFKLKLTFIKKKDLSVSSSWDKYYYDYPNDKNIFACEDLNTFEGCRFISIKTGSEDKFNKNKDIYVGDEDYQCSWFYDFRVSGK